MRSPKEGVFGRPPKIGGIRALPAPLSRAFFAASLAFVADAPRIIFLEIPKLRKYENASTQRRGFGPFPEIGELRSLPVPLSFAFFVASSAFIAGAPRIYFPRNSEITGLRERVDPWQGSLAISEKLAKLGASPPRSVARFRGSVGFHSRRAANYFSRKTEITELRKRVDPRSGSLAISRKWRNWGPPCPTQLRFSRRRWL